jgi:hypothetical protein
MNQIPNLDIQYGYLNIGLVLVLVRVLEKQRWLSPLPNGSSTRTILKELFIRDRMIRSLLARTAQRVPRNSLS